LALHPPAIQKENSINTTRFNSKDEEPALHPATQKGKWHQMKYNAAAPLQV